MKSGRNDTSRTRGLNKKSERVFKAQKPYMRPVAQEKRNTERGLLEELPSRGAIERGEKGILRDSEGKPVKSGSGETVKTEYKKGGKVRGSGCAKRGVKKCKIY